MAFFGSPLRPMLAALRHAPVPILTATRAFSLLNQTPTSISGARVTRALPRPAFSGAARECPTPVILVRAHGLGALYGPAAAKAAEQSEAKEDWSDWAGMFAERGYTTLEVDVAAPESALHAQGEGREAATAVLGEMSKLLASQIRLLAIPFAPIIISEGHSTWLAQAYVEDNPASGLVMIDPAPSAGDATAVKDAAAPRFGYEPHFPVLLVGSPAMIDGVRSSRVGEFSGQGVRRGGKGVTIKDAPEGPRSETRRLVSPG